MASDRVDTSVQVLEVSGDRQERLRYELKRLPWIPVVIIALMIFAAIFAPLIAPHSPTKQSLRDKLQAAGLAGRGRPPSTCWAPTFWVGTSSAA